MNGCVDKEFRLGVKIPLNDAASVIEASQLIVTHDLGSCIIHRMLHPVYGEIFLVNTDGGESIILK
ncbi:hypothetical protein [Ferrovum sp.]|uniref:hypothetical protein n=1 Tax=Ferrovum sp. TaxID=2609467 RepID=UPI00262F9861|nr:hypothetical protein [Ferrovum sp.]